MIPAADLYGRGLSFPVRVGLDGRLAVSEGEANVREALCVLLRTARLERVERPEYGCGVDQYLYDSNDLATLRLIQEEVKRAIASWEPRVTLDDVRVAVDPADPRAVDITVVYTLVASGAAGRVDLSMRS
jgi:phage baseplate assembly protein W